MSQNLITLYGGHTLNLSVPVHFNKTLLDYSSDERQQETAGNISFVRKLEVQGNLMLHPCF